MSLCIYSGEMSKYYSHTFTHLTDALCDCCCVWKNEAIDCINIEFQRIHAQRIHMNVRVYALLGCEASLKPSYIYLLFRLHHRTTVQLLWASFRIHIHSFSCRLTVKVCTSNGKQTR